MHIFENFNEMKSSVGKELGASDWIEITQDHIDREWRYRQSMM